MRALMTDAHEERILDSPQRRVPVDEVRVRRAVGDFVQAQTLNTARHVAALRPFRRQEFGQGMAVPSEAHVQAANELIRLLRSRLDLLARQVREAAAQSEASPTTENLHRLLHYKDRAGHLVKYVEGVWDYYFELFGQRQSQFGNWLLAMDRLALDCYQAVYTGLGSARTIPSPGPFSIMKTGFAPATYRRGVPLARLGKQANPFPIIELPYHRMVNPWTLGAVHHEVSHNLQSDLGLWEEAPRRVFQRLRAAGIVPDIAGMWARWNKEIWADLCGVLLGGPAIVPSLMDVVAMSPRATQTFNPQGVHPTPYLRVLINVVLLRRIGFREEADAYAQLWQWLYPTPKGSIPSAILDTFQTASEVVVETIAFEPYPSLGGKALAEVVQYTKTHQAMTEEAAVRLANGIDPGIIPPRFLVGAVRYGIDRELASPEQIRANFYLALLRR